MKVRLFATATLVAGAVAMGACSAGLAAGGQVQQVTINVEKHGYSAPGLSSLRPGLVTFHVRNRSNAPHAAGFVRLTAGTTPAAVTKVLSKDVIPDKLPFTLLGGVPQVAPGQQWQGTVKLTPGRYLVFDDGGNGKGFEQVFAVAGGAADDAAPPAAVGTVKMTDYAFGFQLPSNWNGKGVLRVPNYGREIHELTFVRFRSVTLERKLEAVLRKGYPQGGPPKGAQIFYTVGGMSAGQTTYVRVDLPPGRYLAVCLMPDASGKPQTADGMMSTLVIH